MKDQLVCAHRSVKTRDVLGMSVARNVEHALDRRDVDFFRKHGSTSVYFLSVYRIFCKKSSMFCVEKYKFVVFCIDEARTKEYNESAAHVRSVFKRRTVPEMECYSLRQL